MWLKNVGVALLGAFGSRPLSQAVSQDSGLIWRLTQGRVSFQAYVVGRIQFLLGIWTEGLFSAGCWPMVLPEFLVPWSSHGATHPGQLASLIANK